MCTLLGAKGDQGPHGSNSSMAGMKGDVGPPGDSPMGVPGPPGQKGLQGRNGQWTLWAVLFVVESQKYCWSAVARVRLSFQPESCSSHLFCEKRESISFLKERRTVKVR